MTYRYDIRDSINSRVDPALGPNPERTICDVHRDAYLIARDAGDETMMALLAEAFDMGKRMSAKLYEYNAAGFAARGRKS